MTQPDSQEREGRPTPAKVETASVSTAIKNNTSVAMVRERSRDLGLAVVTW
jgi:hypothetical protein